jgi:hypothetical protein
MFTYPVLSSVLPAGVQSIQTVTGSTTGTSTTLSFGSLTNASKCVPFVSCGIASGDFGFSHNGDTITWTADVFDDAGTVKCTLLRTADDPANSDFDFSVTLVQFADSYTVAKYSGTMTGAYTLTGYEDVAITSVPTGSAFIIGSLRYVYSTQHTIGGGANSCMRLTSSTNARLHCYPASPPTTANYIFYVVSDPAGNMQVSSATGTESNTSTFTDKDLTVSIDPTTSLLIASQTGPFNMGYYPQRICLSAEPLNSTTVRFSRNTGHQPSNSEWTFAAQVIQIPKLEVVHGIHSWTAAAKTATKTISAVDTARSAAISTMPGCLNNGQDALGFDSRGPSYGMNKIQLTASTSVSLSRGPSTLGSTGRIAYQVLSYT